MSDYKMFIEAIRAIDEGRMTESKWQDPFRGSTHIFRAGEARWHLTPKNVRELGDVENAFRQLCSQHLDREPLPVRLFLRSPQ